MVTVADILNWLDSLAPFRYSASWDHCGLQVGSPGAEVERVLVALEPGTKSLGEAVYRKCQCLVTHHPLLFNPVYVIRQDMWPGNLISTAVKEEVNLVAAHSNLDAARDGTNEQMAKVLGLQSVEALETEGIWEGEERYAGLGCVGTLPRPVRLREFALFSEKAFGCMAMRVVGNPDKRISRVAICSGSGGSLLDAVVEKRADVYITGDVKYHEAVRAEEDGLAIVDIGHFSSERVVVRPLAEYLRSRAAREQAVLEVYTADTESDPFLVLRD